MKTIRIDLPVQLNGLHQLITDSFAVNKRDALIVDGLDNQWIRFSGEAHADVITAINKIPSCILYADKYTINSEGTEFATITVKAFDQSSGNIDVVYFDRKTPETKYTISVSLTNGQGSFEFDAAEAGQTYFEIVSANRFARCRVEAK